MTEEQYMRWAFDRAKRAGPVIQRAMTLMKQNHPDPIAIWAIDGCLRSVLTDLSPFWMRWSYFLKTQEVEKNTAVCEDPGIWCDFPEQAHTLREFLDQGDTIVTEMRSDAKGWITHFEDRPENHEAHDALVWWAERWKAFLRKYTQEPLEESEREA